VGNSYFQKEVSSHVTLVGLDFGSTTSSAMLASAPLVCHSSTGRMAFGSPEIIYRSELVFTPFQNTRMDLDRLSRYLDYWIRESNTSPEEIFSGGAIITGLAAEQSNAKDITKLIRSRIGEAVIATADDPQFESWLAFMGSCFSLSKLYPDLPFINIDIGGGTSNPALGMNGNVISTGCFFIGARHFRFKPGTYFLTGISDYGKILLNGLKIKKSVGSSLDKVEINAILDFYIEALHAIVTGDNDFFTSAETARLHQQVPFNLGEDGVNGIIIFSGGVGELIYSISQGKSVPGTTFYGDLGIDIALKILQAPELSANIQNMAPENMGRATVYGLAVHNTEISGTTIYVSDSRILPRRDVPIVARLTLDADEKNIANALAFVLKNRNGGCIQVVEGKNSQKKQNSNNHGEITSYSQIKGFAEHLSRIWNQTDRPSDHPLIMLVSSNYGHVLGNCISHWGQSRVKLAVIDEIPDRHAQFVNIGNIQNNIVPVTFYSTR